MPKPLDALAGILERLLGDESVPASALSGRSGKRLAPLFDAGALVEERRGAGRAICLRNRRAVQAFAEREYPAGLYKPDDLPMSRADAVRTLRNAKRARASVGEPVLLRGFGTADLRRGADVLPVAELTRMAHLAVILLGEDPPWYGRGTVAVVENLDAFLGVERVIPGIDWAIYAGGRLSGRARDWLAGSALADCRFVHWGDYDPVGLDEYLGLRQCLGERLRLHVPGDLQGLLERYGKPALLTNSCAILARLRQSADADVRRVVAMLDQANAGLEQEALLT